MEMDLDKSTMYLADFSRIRYIKMKNYFVGTLAGTLNAGKDDGRLVDARFSLIQGLHLNDVKDTLYFSDRYNHRIGQMRFFKPGLVSHTIFEHNRAAFIGGGMCLSNILHRADDRPSLEVTECSFESNEAISGTGGGLSTVAAEKILIQRCRFLHNVAMTSGGGVYMQYVGKANLRDNSFDGGNQARLGSAVFYTTTYEADPNYRSVHQDPFYVAPDSVVFHDGGILLMNGNVVSNNAAGFAGAVHIEGRTMAYIDGTNFTRNIGGAVHAAGRSKLYLRDSWMHLNTNVGSGGAVALSGSSRGVLTSVTVTGNVALHGGGGYISDHAILEITNCTLVGNVATMCGGGFALNSSEASVWDGVSTASRNTAWNGGGICLMLGINQNCWDFPFLMLGNGTVMMHENRAELGGGNMFVRCVPGHFFPGSAITQLAETGSTVFTRSEPPYAMAAPDVFFSATMHGNHHYQGAEDHGKDELERRDLDEEAELGHGLRIVGAEGSGSGYGAWLATSPLHLELQEFVSGYAPGESIMSSVHLVDGLFQKMLRKSGEPLEVQVLVEVLFTWGTAPRSWHDGVYVGERDKLLESIQNSSVHQWWKPSQYPYAFQSDGVCRVSNLFLEWPVWNGAPADNVVVVHDPAGDIISHVVAFSASRNPCTAGTYISVIKTDGVYSLTLCQPCQISTYSIVNDSRVCNPCPAGGICSDGHFAEKQHEGSEWIAQGGLMRLAACKAGFVLVRDELYPRFDQCVMCPLGTFLDKAPVLSSRYLVASEAAVATTLCRRCPDGMRCDGGSHIVPADIQIFALDSPNASSVGPLGSCLRRMSECANSTQNKDAWFLVKDRKKRTHLNISWVLHLPLALVQGSAEKFAPPAARRQDGATGEYMAKIATKEVGSWVLEFIVDGVQLRNSPFVLRVTPAECDAASNRAPNDDGTCTCANNHWELGGKCVSNTIFILSVVMPSVGVIGLLACVVDRRRRNNAENYWRIDAREIHFSVPPKVLGQGTFGWVVMAHYRGTAVAVKRVLSYDLDAKSGTADPQDGNGNSRMPALSTNLVPIVEGSEPMSSTEPSKRHRRKAADGYNDSTSSSKKSHNSAHISSLSSFRRGRSEREVASELRATLHQSGLPHEQPHFASGGVDILCSPSRQVTDAGATAVTAVSSQGGNGFIGFVRSFGQSLRRQRNRRRAIRSFLEEIRCIANLRHPNICLVLGAVMSNEEPMLVMEHMQNGSLAQVLANETVALDGETIAMVVTDVIQGMVFLASFSPPIVHGDLKARNILIGSNFRAKVTDFGLTRQRKLGTGTPLWMAPELLVGGETTVKSDVYAFGITLYEILTRKEPYEGEELIDVLQRVIDPAEPEERSRPQIPRSCPASLANEMRRCWSFYPADRPTFHELHTWVRTLDASTILPQSMSHTAYRAEKSPLASASEPDLQKFPKHVSNALAEGKLPPPDTTDCATIFYSDVVGFETLMKQLSASELVDLLDRLYSAFDEIALAYDVFKVETIGDTYVAVTNLATEQDDHAERLTRFALHALRKASTIMVHPEKSDLGFVEVRIGMHSGPLMAAVVGTQTKKYCLFGDSLNIASRIEEAGVSGKVHLTKQCARLVNAQAPDIGIVERGVINVKGMGKMRTYYLVRDSDLGGETYMPPGSLHQEPGDFEVAWAHDEMSSWAAAESQSSNHHASDAASLSMTKRMSKPNLASWFRGGTGTEPAETYSPWSLPSPMRAIAVRDDHSSTSRGRQLLESEKTANALAGGMAV
mmetsp:Transcript_35415/g.85507  ORF Transcript_35415/g.85507 Transcript_35415/m.85507 type:complete len:1753 (+) Transcript_35415:88-5346(+)